VPPTPPSQERSNPPASDRGSLGRLAGWCYDHRRIVLLGWLGVLIAVTLVSQSAGSRFQDNFSSGNSPSQQVQNLLAANFPAQAGSPADVVFRTAGPVTTSSTRVAIGNTVAAIEKLPHVTSVISPFSAAASNQVSKDGHIAFAVVQFDEQADQLPGSAVQKVIDTAQSFQGPATLSSSAETRSARSSPRHRGRARASGSPPRSSSCCWHSGRWSRWACPS
jgi:RND superfamily putative drug exporter